MSASKQEAELKFELQPAEFERLRTHPALKALSVGRAQTKNLVSIYFDTADDVLAAAGIALRVRKVGGKWIQTVKQGKALRGGLSTPMELEVPVSGPDPRLDLIEDRAMAEAIDKLIGEGPLLARYETRIRRTIRMLKVDDGEIECALDTGEVIAGEAVQPLMEAELELTDGSLGALYDAARLIFDDGPLRFSALSKAARGYRLARGVAPEEPAPKKKLALSLKAEMTTEEAYADILRACLDAIAHNRLATLAGNDPEGPHQLRVALRRLRSAFKIFRPLADDDLTRRLDSEAREIGLLVGALRDADVVLADIVAPVAEAETGCTADGVPVDMQPLIATLEAQRVKVRAEVVAGLSAPAINAFLLDLGRYTETRGWLSEDVRQTKKLARPVADFAGKALVRRWKVCAKAGSKLDSLNVEERHALRKKLKTLRYTAEFFNGLGKDYKMKAFIRELRALQEIFGYLNDVVMAEKLVEMDPGARSDRDAALKAAGFVMGWHLANAENAWGHAKERWEALADVKTWWN